MSTAAMRGRDTFPPRGENDTSEDKVELMNANRASSDHEDFVDEDETVDPRRVQPSRARVAPNSLWTAALALAAFACGLLSFQSRHLGEIAQSTLLYPHLDGVWSEFGEEGLHRIGTKPLQFRPACNRTILFQWVRVSSPDHTDYARLTSLYYSHDTDPGSAP